MKSIGLPMVMLFALAGCATTQGITQTGSRDGGASSPATAWPDPQPAAVTNPPFQDNLTPRLVQPVTGGPPAIGIPLGGNLFQPLTGGPPVVGIDLGP